MASTRTHDNRILDLSVRAATIVSLAALCTTALAGPSLSRGGVGSAAGAPREDVIDIENVAWRADLSGNGVVDFADITLFLAAWDQAANGQLTDPGQADINLDGALNFADLNIILACWGMAVSPPQSDNGHLEPGEGFAGATAQPAAVGAPGSPGFDAKAIARWDVVPHQEIDGEFRVGVVAFHRRGIDRVEFSLDGGPSFNVQEMSLNEQTGVWEYWATVNTNELPDGPIELRAIAYPNVGVPRVLEPLLLNANAHGSWGRGEVWVSSLFGNDQTGNGSEGAPFKSIWKAMQSFGSGANIDGLTVHLKPGEYMFTGLSNPYPVTQAGWVTISAAPGVDAADVRLIGDPANVGNNRLRVARVHLRNLSLAQQSGWGVASFNTLSPMLWLDSVRADGPGPFTGAKPFHYANWNGVYVTNAHIANYKDGCLGAQLARHVDLEHIGSDAFTNSMLVIAGSVRDLQGNVDLGYHPDVYQFFGVPGEVRENVIVYGLRAYDVWGQGIFSNNLAGARDIAFVNVMIERTITPQYGPNDPTYSQWTVEPTDHLLLWHVTLENQEMRWSKDGITNLSVVGSCFEAFRGVGETLNLNGDSSEFEAMGDWRSNHYKLGTGYGVLTPGQDVTTGDPGFMNPAAEDFRPGPGSPLRARMNLMCRPAADGAERQEVTSVGAFER